MLHETSNIKTGKLGENLACEYLVKKGYRILKRNYRKPWGEIDIVAKSKSNVLVFVEVKALRTDNDDSLVPEDHLTASKLKKLQRTCRKFVSESPYLLDEKRGWQIDLVAIKIPKLWDQSDIKNCSISHYENI